jgi:hypothetical protein
MNTILTPALLIAAAQPFVGLGERALIDRVLREVNAAESQQAWDAAFVHHVGYWSHYSDHEKSSTWPLPAAATVEELAQACDSSGLLRGTPMPGDLFLLNDQNTKCFTRTGIIVMVSIFTQDDECGVTYDCITIEGDSTHHSVGDGPRVLRHRRTLSPELGDKFIRWTAHDDDDKPMSVTEEALEDAREAALENAPQSERAA